jgi:putative transposase
MGRALRTQAGGLVYHVLNRANGRGEIFENWGDYEAFLRVLADAQAEVPTRVLFYCIMPNHWHLVFWPELDDTLSRFVGWLTLTHTQRRHAYRHSAGSGHLYQGRFKSFVVEADEHLLTVGRYTERNAQRANLVARAEDWRWGSLWQRTRQDTDKRPELTAPPVPLPVDWTEWVNTPQTAEEELVIRRCCRRGQPFGKQGWVESLVKRYGLDPTQRCQGRPAQASHPGQLLLFEENGS